MQTFPLQIIIFRKICLSLLGIVFISSLSSCRISSFEIPEDAEPGSLIQIRIEIIDDVVPESTISKGVLALIVPRDWVINSASWDMVNGGGQLEYSGTWSQRAAAKFPLTSFEQGMEWVAFRTDSAFSYTAETHFQALISIQVGDSLGLYKLGCVATRNTHNGSGSWTKVSYPHFTGVPALSDHLSYRVEAADDWTSLFSRDSGWTGGDGTYSIPLDGSEIFSSASDRMTLFHFSDTFIGTVSESGSRLNGSYLINNSQALLTGSQPIVENINFIWGEDGESNATWIVPSTPLSQEGDWFWQMDGISLADSLHIFELRMKSHPTNGFAISGVVLASGVIDTEGQITGIQQKDLPIEYTNPNDGSQIAFGQAIMPQTVRSGCPNPDGYIYVYGPRSYSGGKALVAARVAEDSLSYSQSWRYWNGTDWSSNIADCADIISGISQEHSVIQNSVGDYLITYLQDGVSGPVCIAHAETPVGPFSFPEVVWTPPETDISNNVFTYNAKAHPHLSAPGELLMSYEVNTFDFWEHFSNADIYHPRFIRLVTDNFVSIDADRISRSTLPSEFKVIAFPNPFNGQVTLRLAENNGIIKRMTIYDLSGRQIKYWDQAVLANRNEIEWDGRNTLGQIVSTGLYLVNVELKGRDNYSMTKITLLK